ncbi:MAG: aminopeptidase [Candidatus Woesebacteria bacterium]|jgi:leucyl aminopeptidase (aminopeptidase T)
MKIHKIISADQSLLRLQTAELRLGQKILKNNLNFQKNDNVLIVTDIRFYKKEAAIWFETAKTLTDKVQMIVLAGMTHSGQEPPDEVVQACAQANITILHTKFSLTHSKAGKAVVRNNHRGASLPGVNYKIMRRTLTTDYHKIKKLGEEIKAKLQKANTIHISSPSETNFSAAIRQKAIFNDGGILKNGELGNLPAGEVFFAPIKGSSQGTWIINGALADFKLKKPIKVTIKNGLAVKFESESNNHQLAQALEEKLKKIGPDAFNIAEIGIGTNPKTNPLGKMIEAEKALKTAHIAFGNSSCIGGEVDVPIHLDALTLKPIIKIDGKKLAL